MFQQKDTNSGKRKITAAITAVIVIVLTAVVVFFDFFSSEELTEQTGFAMGSEIRIQIYEKTDDAVFTEIFDSISETETNFISRYKENSEIFKLNEQKTFTVSDKTKEILEKAIEISENSDGAFDITIGELSALWNFDSAENIIPDEEKIKSALSYSGYEKPTINGNAITLGENQTIDSGALGKGYACDVALDILKKNDIENAIISVGGTVLTYGEKERNIGIRAPEKDDFSSFLKITLSGTNFISTSGNYEKAFEKNGKIYHHILDPKTGYPAENNLKSVTVISENGIVSDALSTACFVLGKENCASLLEKYNAQAIFVDSENNVYITNGIIDSCTVLNDNYRISSYE